MSYNRGVIFILFAGVFLSTSGVFVRNLETSDPWIVLFYRSLAFALTVLVFLLLREGRNTASRFLSLGWSDVVVSVCLAFGFIFYLLSLFHTTVANTVFLLSTGPFIAALLGWVVLGEKVGAATWAAMAVAACGIGIMVYGGLEGGHVRGQMLAFAAVCVFAVMVVAMRRNATRRDMLPATGMAGVLASLFCLPFIDSFSLSAWDMLMSFCLGSVQIGAGFILIALGARKVPAAQIPLLALGETALAPLWVWWLVNEVPLAETLTGGAIVLSAVLFQGVLGVRQERRRIAATA